LTERLKRAVHGIPPSRQRQPHTKRGDLRLEGLLGEIPCPFGEQVRHHGGKPLFARGVLGGAAGKGELDRDQRDAMLLYQPGLDALGAGDFLHAKRGDWARGKPDGNGKEQLTPWRARPNPVGDRGHPALLSGHCLTACGAALGSTFCGNSSVPVTERSRARYSPATRLISSRFLDCTRWGSSASCARVCP